MGVRRVREGELGQKESARPPPPCINGKPPPALPPAPTSSASASCCSAPMLPRYAMLSSCSNWMRCCFQDIMVRSRHMRFSSFIWSRSRSRPTLLASWGGEGRGGGGGGQERPTTRASLNQKGMGEEGKVGGAGIMLARGEESKLLNIWISALAPCAPPLVPDPTPCTPALLRRPAGSL